jgi:putative DNA primase/helicase
MRASSVQPVAVTWLWEPYIPLGKISVIAGQMGQAKSLLTCWLAALVSSRGHGVVMLSAEDDPADTIRPRLEAVHADLERVEIAPDVTLDAERLAVMCDELGDVKLITVDPIQAYLPSSVNSWKGQDVRLALEPARQIAADRKVAIALIQHLNRRSDGDPLARIADSQGVPQLARSVMIWGPDPGDPEGDHGTLKVLTRVKGNLARSSNASATFTIAEEAVAGGFRAPLLVRGEDAQITADDVIADQQTRTARDEAVDWLRDLLAAGPVAAKEVRRQARADGISDRTLDRAKVTLRAVSEPSRDTTNISGWIWRLSDSHLYTSGDVGVLGDVGDLGSSKNAKVAKNVKDATHTQVTTKLGVIDGGRTP